MSLLLTLQPSSTKDAVYMVRSTIFMFATAVLFAYLLAPLVGALQRRLPCAQPHVSRPIALFVVYVVLGGGAVLLAVLLGGAVVDQVSFNLIIYFF